jgi:pimeloyl-ACP methyl ester carboxylesterase
MEKLSPPWAARVLIELMKRPRRFTRPAREQALLLTADPFQLATTEGKMAAWSWGRGPLVFMLHGWEGRGTQMGGIISALVEQGFQVVAWDGPGHGDSPGFTADPLMFANTLMGAEQQLGSPHAVISHSMGAISTNIAMRRGFSTNCLVFMGPGGAPERGVQIIQHLFGVTKATEHSIRNRIASNAGFSWEELDCALALKQSSLPLLIIHDADDMDAPLGVGNRIAESWGSSASRHQTTGLGHRKILWDPHCIKQAVSFVDQHSIKDA